MHLVWIAIDIEQLQRAARIYDELPVTGANHLRQLIPEKTHHRIGGIPFCAQQIDTLKRCGPTDTRAAGDSGCQINIAGDRVADLSRSELTRIRDDERHRDGFIVHYALGSASMRTRHLAMVRRIEDYGFVGATG